MPIRPADAMPSGYLQPVRSPLTALKDNVGCRILLAGNDSGELNVLTAYLGGSYLLSRAGNEKAVLHLLETQDIHLIISSLELTDSTGVRLCANLKSSGKYSHIPVILLTDGEHSMIRSLQSGADACIERPLSGIHLKVQIGNLLANRARLKDYFARSLSADRGHRAYESENEVFLQKLHELISMHLGNQDLNVDMLAKLMNMTRPTFYRKIKSVSELTPNEIVNEARLKKAVELIQTSGYKIFEVAKMVGFNSQSNFGKAFFKQFRATPTEYQRTVRGLGRIRAEA